MSKRSLRAADKDNDRSNAHHPKREKLDLELTKKGRTCIPCRDQKKKCDGQEPCERCISKKKACSYVVHVEDKEMQDKVAEMEALQKRLDDLKELIEQKQQIRETYDKEHGELKKEFHRLTNRSMILFDSPYEDRTIQILDHYKVVFYPTTRNIMPYDRATDFLQDENPARVACMCAMLANGSLVVGDMNNAKKLVGQAKQNLANCLERLVIVDMFLYTSALVDLGTHYMTFCDLTNARTYFYKIIELAHSFPQQFFSQPTTASRSSFALAEVSDGVKANAASCAYHLGYAYEALMVICTDKELDDLHATVAVAPNVIDTHRRFHELRLHLDKLNQIAIIFSYEKSNDLFNCASFIQELHHTKQKIDILDPNQYAYLVGLEKVVRMHGFLADENKFQETVSAIEDVWKFAMKSLQLNKANLLAFAMLYAAMTCRYYLDQDAMVLLRMSKEVEAESSGVDLATVCLQEYQQTVFRHCRVNPYFEKFSLQIDMRQSARLKPADLRRFALPKATMQQLTAICNYTAASNQE